MHTQCAESIAKKTGILNDLEAFTSSRRISRFENTLNVLNGIKDFSENAAKGYNKLSDFMQDVAL